MKLYVYVSLIVVVCIITPVLSQRRFQQQQQQAQYCVTPENYYGTCVPLNYCPQISNVFRTTNQRQAQQYIIQSQRACSNRNFGGESVVCCTRPLSAPYTTERPLQTTTIFNNPFLSSTEAQVFPPHPLTTRASITPPITTTKPSTTNENIIEEKGASCIDPNLRDGTCMPIKNCQILIDELQVKQTDAKFSRFLRASNRICGGTATNVCCANPQTKQPTTSRPFIMSSNEIPTRLPTAEQGCGYSNNTFKRVVGGAVSKKGAWPWVALLGYNDELSASPFKCGGTLVTERHVITAAHCVRNDLSFVRLGEHDLTTDTEARHVDIRVIRTEAHPSYNRRNGHSDIAILYLEHNVEFSSSISPICMPTTTELRQKTYVNYTPFVVGWGKTLEGGKAADILQELQIPIYENEVCRDSYRRQNRLFTEDQFDNAVLCAGVLSGGKDTCQGDSGGPLMAPEEFADSVRFYLIGVVSYGIGCARPNIPGVYTSTQHFMDWIIEKIADTP